MNPPAADEARGGAAAMPTVAFAERPPGAVRQIAREVLGDFRLRIPTSDAGAAVRAAVRGAAVLLARSHPIGPAELDLARPQLVVMLGRHPVAVDEKAAAARGIPVRSIPHPGAIAVADHTLALLLAVARRILEGDRGVRAGAYRDRGLEPRATTERSYAFNWLGRGDVLILEGLRLGLIGFGAIGQETARRALGFGMAVRYLRRRPLPERWNRIFGAEPAGSLEELLETSEVVSLHCPQTSETENLLDGEALDRMRPGAILVNTARGALVDEAALAARLQSGRLGGAGLDVFREEPLPAGHPLLGAPRTVLAPHTGGAGAGGQRELFERAAGAVRTFFARRTPETRS